MQPNEAGLHQKKYPRERLLFGHFSSASTIALCASLGVALGSTTRDTNKTHRQIPGILQDTSLWVGGVSPRREQKSVSTRVQRFIILINVYSDTLASFSRYTQASHEVCIGDRLCEYDWPQRQTGQRVIMPEYGAGRRAGGGRSAGQPTSNETMQKMAQFVTAISKAMTGAIDHMQLQHQGRSKSYRGSTQLKKELTKFSYKADWYERWILLRANASATRCLEVFDVPPD